MVKFAKELDGQKVPEWEDAYCNYAELKRDLKRIQQHRTMGATFTRSGTSLGLLRSVDQPVSLTKTLTRTFTRTFSRARSILASPLGRPEYMPSFSPRAGQHSCDTIVVNKRRTEDGEVYVTELREPLVRSPQDRTFFARLDAQLTKVNKFYKQKEAEDLARAGAIEKEMTELINAEEAIARQDLRLYDSHLDYLKNDRGAHHTEPDRSTELYPGGDQSELSLIREEMERSDSSFVNPSWPGGHKDSGEEDEVLGDATQRDVDRAVASKNLKSGDVERRHIKLESPASGSMFKLRSAVKTAESVLPESVDREKYTVTVAHIPGDDETEKQKTYTQKELDQAKKQLQRAFLEFYRSLGFLSSYRSVNISAFAKITKKYDTVTGWHLASIYMKEVEASHFVLSKKIHKLATKTEELFAKHFANGDRKKAMMQLRPVRTKGTHLTTFFVGLFTGSSIALFVTFFSLVSNPLAMDRGGGVAYLDTMFPVFSTLILGALHLYLYAFNVYAWQRTRINYPFIFGFSPNTELRYREVLLLSTGLTTFFLGGMNIHIAVTVLTHPAPVHSPPGMATRKSSTVTDVIPLIIVLTTLAALFLPINIIYRSSRFFFLNCFRRLALAPLYEVTLPDNFLGDQLTSQILVFRNLEFVACYYASGFFLTQEDQACKANNVYQGFGYVVGLVPYWWRILQCLRRYYDSRDRIWLEAAARLTSVFAAVGLKQAYGNYRSSPEYERPLRVLFVTASIITTVISSYSDLCLDWSLLNRHSKNKWLRDKIILKHKSLYFVAMVSNCFLRLAWLATLVQPQVSFGFHQNAFDVVVASLEVLRRGIWNFFKIENEHLTNVDKFRAEVAVPLPFHDDQ